MSALDAIESVISSVANICNIELQVRAGAKRRFTTPSFDEGVSDSEVDAVISEMETRGKPFQMTLPSDGAMLHGLPLNHLQDNTLMFLALVPPHSPGRLGDQIPALLYSLGQMVIDAKANESDMDQLAEELAQSYEELALYRHLQDTIANSRHSRVEMFEIIPRLREVLKADLVFGHFPEMQDLNFMACASEWQGRMLPDVLTEELSLALMAMATEKAQPYIIIPSSTQAPCHGSLQERPLDLVASQAICHDHAYGWLAAVRFDCGVSFKRNQLNLLKAASARSAAICANTHLLQGLTRLNTQVKTFKSELAQDLGRSDACAGANPGQADFLDRGFQRLSEGIEETKRLILRNAQMATMGQLSAVFAHEIKQPVTALDSFIQIAQLKDHDDEMDEILQHLTRVSNRLQLMIKRFESFSRPVKSVFKSLSLNSIAREVYQLVQPQLKMKSIEGNLHSDDRLPNIMGDQEGLQQVVLNLVTNAISAMEKCNGRRPILEISTYREDGLSCLDVADNGAGIPEDLRGRIMEPYYTTKPDGKGTGLGLSVVTNIIEQHDGHFEMESASGSGSRFSIKIPLPHGQPEPIGGRSQ